MLPPSFHSCCPCLLDSDHGGRPDAWTAIDLLIFNVFENMIVLELILKLRWHSASTQSAIIII